jgi:hypothetical protein
MRARRIEGSGFRRNRGLPTGACAPSGSSVLEVLSRRRARFRLDRM